MGNCSSGKKVDEEDKGRDSTVSGMIMIVITTWGPKSGDLRRLRRAKWSASRNVFRPAMSYVHANCVQMSSLDSSVAPYYATARFT